MNNQEAFDIVAVHLFTQGERAMGLECSCMYRSECGLKCAIGCLIPDEEYKATFEGKGAIAIQSRVPTLVPLDSWLLDRLQSAHDQVGNWVSTGFMKEALQKIAFVDDLNDDVLKTLSFKDR